MGNTQINEVTKHKHLGLRFSSEATWIEHIGYIIEEAWKRIRSKRRNKFMLDRLSLLSDHYIIWDNCSIENMFLGII